MATTMTEIPIKDLALTTDPSNKQLLVRDVSAGLQRIDYDQLAKSIIETYTKSSISGKNQSLKNAIDLINQKIRVIFTANGQSSSVPYTQTISGLNIKETDTPEIQFDYPNGVGNNFDYDKYSEQTSYITYCETGNGTITAVCKKNKPTQDLVVVFKGI